MTASSRGTTSLAVRKGLVRWYGACTLLWVTVSVLVAWIARDDLPSVSTVWLVIVPAFILLSAFIVRRMVRQLEALDDDHDGLQAAYDLALVGSLRDSLTGLGSHRAFQDRLDLRASSSDRHYITGDVTPAYLDRVTRIIGRHASCSGATARRRVTAAVIAVIA